MSDQPPLKSGAQPAAPSTMPALAANSRRPSITPSVRPAVPPPTIAAVNQPSDPPNPAPDAPLGRVVSLAETTKLHAVSGLDRTVKRIEQVVSLVSKPLGVGAYGLKKPRGMKWRSSAWFLTAVVCIGVMSDLLAYAIIVPILPYRLLDLGYTNVAALTSWLLFAYSAGIFLGTIPVAFFFHRYPYRRGPLVGAVLLLELSFLLFMFAEPYWCMVVSRFIQGITSCVVWTVGFALICENIDPAHLGFYMGFAFTGVTVGVTIAPPIGGALYQQMGWYAPFIFCIIVCGADTIARLFVLDKRDLEMWRRRVIAHEKEELAKRAEKLGISSEELAQREHPSLLDSPTPTQTGPAPVDILARPVELGGLETLKALASLPRGLVAFGLFFVFGFIIGALDATITIRVEDVWKKDAQFVGLIYLAAAAPAFFIGPIAGHIADKIGTEWVIAAALALCLPWLPLMTLTSSLPAFVVYMAMVQLVVAMLNTVASLEMAIVSKHREGISEIHQFAALNIAFAISSAVGAIAGGQIYDGVKNGWNVLCWVGFAFFVAAIAPPLIWTGTRPMLWRVLGRPGPRSGMHPDELRRMDGEAAAEAEAGRAGKAGAGAGVSGEGDGEKLADDAGDCPDSPYSPVKPSVVQ